MGILLDKTFALQQKLIRQKEGYLLLTCVWGNPRGGRGLPIVGYKMRLCLKRGAFFKLAVY